jgi:predicted nucleotidyltransferase
MPRTSASKTKSARAKAATKWYGGADVPMSAIRRFARRLAERFKPEKIVLFGSHAYGRPHEGSDVDILVVMPTRNELDQAAKISVTLDPPFPLDLIVRTPHNMQWRLAEGDWFLREITSKGKVLYEAPHRRVGAKSRSGFRDGNGDVRQKQSNP